MTAEFAQVQWRGLPARIEVQRLNPQLHGPLMIFLHEGLGSISMWRDFPQRLCDALGFRGLVYSRPGYGQSTPRPRSERWGPDFMHQQARELLPALLEALKIDVPYWLLGHSDGGSIALLHAAAFPRRVAGLVALAPHILVEDISVTSIAKTREVYLNTDLREKLARHHADPDSAFWGWNDIWLAPAFRHWSIENEIRDITCPLLAVQGLDDEYGTLEQIRGIARRVPQAHLLELPGCGHSPHRDQPDALIQAVSTFIRPTREHKETRP
ncbi:alpha/beta fold hydrolase [Pelomonas sp. KK5]|uniref:alpha/beta fold hydrolase n=1 Tax=Pelomonas sp. KK5 TaxID=1855730 RepID=UPI00097C5CCC|nr:alpha/beta hydrolase [Pelomonas sp. KK5]